MNPPLPDHDYHVMSDAELSCIIKSASEVAMAMRGVDARTRREYLDQVDNACTILNYRAANPGANQPQHKTVSQRKLEMIKRIEALIAALSKEDYARAVGSRAP
jgi:hypothetical protein